MSSKNLIVFLMLFAFVAPAFSEETTVPFSEPPAQLVESDQSMTTSETVDSLPAEETEKPSLSIQAKETPAKTSTITVTREFKLVDPSQLELDVEAVKEEGIAAKDEVDRKIRAEYVPIRVSIINKSGKLLKIPKENIYYLNAQNEPFPLPADETIFKNIKRNGVGRALLWGVPLGLVSFGILAAPAFIWSGSHTKITNGTVKANLEKSYYHGGHLPPEGGVTTFIFIPKKNYSATKLVLGRVINLEDQVEAEKIIDIRTLEINNAAKK